MVKLYLPAQKSKWSGGGDEVLANFYWARNQLPELFSEKLGSGTSALVLRNNASAQQWFSGDYVVLPQNAWAWIGRRPKDVRWKIRLAALRVTGDLSIRRSRAVIRLSESVPSHGKSNIVLPNVLSESFESVLSEVVALGPPVENPYFYSFGNFIDYRNYDGLIKAYQCTEDSRSLLIHGGVLSQSYLATCQSALKANSRVVIDPNRKSRLEILRHVIWADAVFFPSTAEASPISLLEALALGKSVVCNDIPAHRQEIHTAEQKCVIDTNNSEQLAEVLAGVDSGLGKAGISTIESKHVRQKKRELWLSEFSQFVSSL